MTLRYRVRRGDNGWTHEANGTLSGPFRTREQAREAARLATREQEKDRGESKPNHFEEAQGHWHHD